VVANRDVLVHGSRLEIEFDSKPAWRESVGS
jgi:hypothetical protein